VGVSDTGIGGRRDFPATHWSRIRHADDADSPDYQRHLRQLVELYWKPVYAVIRRSWARGNDDAKDLTQEFFAEVVFERSLAGGYDPDRGSFRVFLRMALTRFMSNVVRDASRQKRGGGQQPVTLAAIEEDGQRAFEALGSAAELSPAEAFDLSWNQAVMEKAVAELERRLVADGKATVFALWKRYDLEGGSEEMSYGALAEAFSLSIPQVKNALPHVRGVLRDVVTEIVRGYVDGPDDLAAELRSLYMR
jgi:RNA polymerase sigma factor (sigma-70 family)